MMLTTIILNDLLIRYKGNKEMTNLLLFYIRLKIDNKDISCDETHEEKMKQLYLILYKN